MYSLKFTSFFVEESFYLMLLTTLLPAMVNKGLGKCLRVIFCELAAAVGVDQFSFFDGWPKLIATPVHPNPLQTAY